MKKLFPILIAFALLCSACHTQEEEVATVRWAGQTEIEAMIDDGSFIPYQKGLLDYLFFARGGKSTWNL